MNFSVRYSPAAVRDLKRVRSEVFNASKDRDTTDRYINGLLDKVESKADYPESGSLLYYENSFTGYYFVVYKAYMAFYRLEKDSLLVDRILFGRSDYLRKLMLSVE